MKLVTAKEASRILGVSSATLRNWEKRGKIQTVLVGVQRRYDLSTVQGVSIVLDNDEAKVAAVVNTNPHSTSRCVDWHMPIDLKEQVKETAEQMGITRSLLVQRILERYFEFRDHIDTTVV